jgi:hypothetical protein
MVRDLENLDDRRAGGPQLPPPAAGLAPGHQQQLNACVSSS